jgi:hypothetical protein
LKVETGVLQLFEFVNWFWFINYFRIRELLDSRSLKNSESNNHWSWIFQKPQRTSGSQERTGNEQVDLWSVIWFFKKLRPMVIYQNQVFDFFENHSYKSG